MGSGTVLTSRWRLLVTPAHSGVENMALDEALLRRASHSGETVVRVYTWVRPTLSLGRNQRAHHVYDPVLARTHGIDIVRRMTGGRALLHHREITYSVSGPADQTHSIAAAYLEINRVLLHALRTLGVNASMAEPGGRTPPPESAPCFETPSRGEIVVGGRKLVGSAQVHEGGAYLQHGSILIDDDQPLITSIARIDVAAPTPAATLNEALGRNPPVAEFADALFAAVRTLVDPEAAALDLDATTRVAAKDAERRYASDAWTWRR